MRLLALHSAREPKITELDYVIRVDETVGGLEVEVKEFILVEILQAGRNLEGVANDALPREVVCSCIRG